MNTLTSLSLERLFCILRAKCMWLEGFSSAMKEWQGKQILRQCEELRALLNQYERENVGGDHDQAK